MRGNKIIAAIIVFLSFAAALENFGTISFIWKLIAVAISAIIILWYAAGWLSKWVKPKGQAGIVNVKPSKSWIRYGASVICVTAICAFFGIITWIIVNYYTIGIEEIATSSGKYEFWIQASVPLAKKVSVRLPPGIQTKCKPVDPPGSGTNRAEAMLIDWDSSNPQLQLSNFSFPQRIGLRCVSRIDLNRITIRIEPPHTPVFFPGHRGRYKMGIFLIGGLLWVVAFLLFIFWSRSR